jgi:uncharacterized protein YjhX (UPF0386 family)
MKLLYILLTLISILNCSDIEYYPACSNNEKSLVDALKSIGVDSSFSNRKKIAELNGVQNYSGQPQQNTELLKKLKNGQLIKSIINDSSPSSDIIYYPACDKNEQSIVKALDSIGVDSSMDNRKKIAAINGISNYQGLYEQNIELLNKLKNGKLIKSKGSGSSSDDPIPIPTPTPSTSSNEMIEKLKKSNYVKKETLAIIGQLLFDNGYETAFVAGVLGNINHEASIGLFESSAYISHPEDEPKYLKYMDQYYSYRTKYSGKLITEVSLDELNTLLNKLKNDKWEKGKFGLGCVQWTGERTLNLFKIYRSENNSGDSISFNQATNAEGKLIINEFSNDYKYIYNIWKEENKNKINSEDAAYNAASKICLDYERPSDMENKAKTRGNTAKKIYKIMTE